MRIFAHFFHIFWIFFSEKAHFLFLGTYRGGSSWHSAQVCPASIEDPDERVGAEIVMRAMPEPCRMISHNAGQEGEVIVARLKGLPFSVGYSTGAVAHPRVGQEFPKPMGGGWGRLNPPPPPSHVQLR